MSGHSTPAVRIAAHRSSRWRCGVQHRDRSRDWPAGHWSPEELERLEADPLITVTRLDEPGPDAWTGDMLGQLESASPEQILEFMRRLSASDRVNAVIREHFEAAEIENFDEEAMTEKTPDDGSGAGEDPPAPEPTRRELIVAAFSQLGEDDYTSSGKPKVTAIERITGLTDVRAGERDVLWRD